jgi:hypothetical protein
LRTGQRGALPKALKSLPQRRVGDAERGAQLGLRVPQTEEKERDVEGRRQLGRRHSVTLVRLGACRPGFERAQKLAGTAARGAAGHERSVLSCGGIGGAREPFAIEGEPAAQRGDDQVVRDVLGFVPDATVPS